MHKFANLFFRLKGTKLKLWTPELKFGIQSFNFGHLWLPIFLGLVIELGGCASILAPSNDVEMMKPQNTHQTHTKQPFLQEQKTYPILEKKKPSPDTSGYVARGHASWYGIEEHGIKTASGQIYDLYGMTAAHPNLPLLAQVKVKNLRTNRSVIVTINDHLVENNALIKLSYQAAHRLGLVKRPSQLVEVRGLPVVSYQ
ncbi:RlpA-like double-psi beta-barrel domain-containing protein [Candidatus Parabeggiatoa sp. HSG14]|uniref:septal ring lytic transglycosylase RlpA family protein n=1 Tax=Candidatus Parabeggiatoa sp. HSG14 TaxID=3055593 RepID=UPI0025A757A1|nr:RlpA-like double-psi beta-barrel domain-containing protein [Thiotrichales bacterium HSG14]